MNCILECCAECTSNTGWAHNAPWLDWEGLALAITAGARSGRNGKRGMKASRERASRVNNDGPATRMFKTHCSRLAPASSRPAMPAVAFPSAACRRWLAATCDTTASRNTTAASKCACCLSAASAGTCAQHTKLLHVKEMDSQI